MNPARKAHLIYNPQAGRLRQNPRRLERALEALSAGGHSVTPQPTRAPGGGTLLARAAVEAGADLILVAGGDGTVNEALNGMVGCGVPLAVLPAGTANVLASELGLPRQPDEAAQRLKALTPARIAVGRLLADGAEPRYFLSMAGVGLDAEIVHRLDLERKKSWGKLAYWMTGLGMLGQRLKEFDVRAEGALHRAGFALASRVRNYGGDLVIAGGASLFDDRFELVSMEGSRSWRYLKYLAGVLTGSLHGMSGVSIMHPRQVEFTAPAGVDVHVEVDGEYAGRLPATVEIIPEALTLLVPGDGYDDAPPAAVSDRRSAPRRP